MYKLLTETKKYSELKAHETLNRVASANAISKHYKSSSLITVKHHAMVLSFFKKANLVNTYKSKNGGETRDFKTQKRVQIPLKTPIDPGKAFFDISVNTGQIFMGFGADTPEK